MSFLKEHEFVVLFDHPFNHLRRDELAALREVGVESIYGFAHWKDIEPKEGVYDWSRIDTLCANARSAGLKIVLGILDEPPTWFPAEDYLRWPTGVPVNQTEGPDQFVWGALSPWNNDARARVGEFVARVRARYDAPDLLVVRTGPHSGESVLPYDAAYFDPCAVQSYRQFMRRYYGDYLAAYNSATRTDFASWDEVIPPMVPHGNREAYPVWREWLGESLVDHVLREQALFVDNPQREVWFMLARCWHDNLQSGNELADLLYQGAREQLGAEAVTGLVYAYFWLSDHLKGLARRDATGQGAEVWVGSEYCEGLCANTDEAIKAGFRGFLTAPCSPCNVNEDGTLVHSRLEPWMLDAFKESLSKWRHARGM